MVVVKSADIPIILGLCSFTASTYFSAETSTPKSTTSKPAPSNIIFTKFFPISCKSPFTVPIATVPIFFTPVSINLGRRILIPVCIARAAIKTSGTYTSFFLNFFPIISIPLIKPFSKISLGNKFCSKACLTSSATFSASPLCKASDTLFKSTITLPPTFIKISSNFIEQKTLMQ